MNNIKDFINEAKKIIRNETAKIGYLHRQIEDYETLIDVIAQTGTTEQVNYYREKINKCHSKIEIALENIKSSRDRIAIMNSVSKIIKRGGKCA